MRTTRSYIAGRAIVIGIDLPSATEIVFPEHIFGLVFIPAGSRLTSIAWHAAPAIGGTYVPLQDDAGNPITSIVAGGRCFAIPSALTGAIAVKAVGNVRETATISLKA